LFYEGLDRIVPENAYYHDHEIVRRIDGEIGFVRNIDPKKFSDSASQKFLDYFKNNILILGEEKFREIISRDDEQLYQIHIDKIGYKVRKELKTYIRQDEGTDWFDFPPILGFIYMSYLANEIGSDKKLPLITDNNGNQTALNISQIKTSDEKKDVAFDLASLAIRSYLPKNIETVSVKQLVNFRRKHEAERIQFYSTINDLVSDLEEIKNKDVLDDILNFRKKKIDASVEALKRSLVGVGIEIKEGLLGVSIPAALQFLPENTPYSTEIKVAGAVCVLLALGYKGFIDKRKIKKGSPYSYLISLEKSKLGEEALLKQLLKGKILI
jgi:hypothetical protein